MDDTRVKSLNLRVLMIATLVWLTSTGSAAPNPGEVAVKMTGRTIETVDLAEGHAEAAHDTRIVFSGRPQARRSAIAIKCRPSDWEGFERLTLRLKPSVAIGRDYVDTCREFGLRVGFYYSLMDWHHADGMVCARDEAARERFVTWNVSTDAWNGPLWGSGRSKAIWKLP